jgi:hypothetical protein
MPRAEGARELLDGPVAPADLAATLADIDRLNAWFGGYALTLREVRRATAGVPPGHPLVVVDVGGGRGDLAVRLVRWARGAGRAIRVVVIDRDAPSLGLPVRAGAAPAEVVRVRADATAMPFRAGAADVVVCSLTLHHLEPDAAVATLAQMRGAARLGVIVNDLLRTRVSLALVWLATRLLARHPMSRHDGPLSVRRAYSPDELRALAARAGLGRLVVRRYPLLGRVVAIAS